MLCAACGDATPPPGSPEAAAPVAASAEGSAAPRAQPAPSVVSQVSAPAPAYAPVSAPGADPSTDKKLRLSIAAGQRAVQRRLLDLSHHPLETLEFLGLRDDMQVTELWPEDGYYTELLAPVLAERGALSVVQPEPGDAGPGQLSALIAASPALYSKLKQISVKPPGALALGPTGSADLVLSVQDTQGWLKAGYALSVFDAAFKALKPAGVLGVVERRSSQPDAPVSNPEETTDEIGLTEAHVRQLALAAGFEFVAKRDVGGGAAVLGGDPEGAAGHRMTLKFIKPAGPGEPKLRDEAGKALPQTEGDPQLDSPLFKHHLRLLAQAILRDDPELARAVFFPVEAYQQVKDIPKPERDWEYRLWKNFKRDVHDYHRRLGAGARFAELVELEPNPRSKSWMKPGSEGNKLGYFRMTHPKLVFKTTAGRTLKLDLTSLISWRGEWYIVHLNGFK